MIRDDSHRESHVLTRDRLLEAAGAVFAERGFRDATVREICRRAVANVAAVNYHFGDKEGLYGQALIHWAQFAQQKYPAQIPTGNPTPAQRLRVFIHSFLQRLTDPGRPSWHNKLLAREMTDPSPVFDKMVSSFIRPQQQVLFAIIADLLGSAVTEDDVRRCTLSVVSQIVFYHHCTSVIERFDPRMLLHHQDLDVLADHITRFSLAGIRAVRKAAEGGKP